MALVAASLCLVLGFISLYVGQGFVATAFFLAAVIVGVLEFAGGSRR